MWKSLKDGLGSVATQLLALAGFCLFFGVAMLPQFGFLWFIETGGGPMLLPIIGLAILGRLFRKIRDYRFSIGFACLCMLAMAMMRGFYWHPFDDGDGFLTANRVTGFVLLLFALASTEIYDRLAKRFGWGFF